jgi:hypothetical protein
METTNHDWHCMALDTATYEKVWHCRKCQKIDRIHLKSPATPAEEGCVMGLTFDEEWAKQEADKSKN